MTNDDIAWSSQLAYDSDVCLSIEYVEGPVEIVVYYRSHF